MEFCLKDHSWGRYLPFVAFCISFVSLGTVSFNIAFFMLSLIVLAD